MTPQKRGGIPRVNGTPREEVERGAGRARIPRWGEHLIHVERPGERFHPLFARVGSGEKSLPGIPQPVPGIGTRYEETPLSSRQFRRGKAGGWCIPARQESRTGRITSHPRTGHAEISRGSRVTATKESAKQRWIRQEPKNRKRGGSVAGFPVLGETFPAVHRSSLGRDERNLALFSTV